MDGSGSITIGLGEFRSRRGKAWRRGNEMKKETEAVRGKIERTRARFSLRTSPLNERNNIIVLE